MKTLRFRKETAVMFEVVHRLPVQVGYRQTISNITVDICQLHLRKTLLFDRKLLARHIPVLETHLADPVALYGNFLVTAVDAVTLLGFIHTAYDLTDFLFDGSFGVIEVPFTLFTTNLLAAYLVLGTSPVQQRVRDGQGNTAVRRAVAHIIEG